MMLGYSTFCWAVIIHPVSKDKHKRVGGGKEEICSSFSSLKNLPLCPPLPFHPGHLSPHYLLLLRTLSFSNYYTVLLS